MWLDAEIDLFEPIARADQGRGICRDVGVLWSSKAVHGEPVGRGAGGHIGDVVGRNRDGGYWLGTLLARHREGMPCLDYLRILGSEIPGLRAFRLCILDTECRGIHEMELERARRS